MEELGLTQLFGSCYAGRRVLVTGHTGFKGSWLVLWLQALGAHVGGLALAPDTNPAHWNLLGLHLDHEARIDLCDADAVKATIEEFRPEIIFHLAAQSLVRRSYRAPVTTFASNVGGLVHVLEAVRACDSVRVVVNATTDKVYEANATPNGYRESDPLGGHDPYGTSKACAELISACYRRSYFYRDDGRGQPVLLATARAGNVIGGGDWAEDRLVPDLVRAAASGHPLRVRNPLATRPWQHVLEPLSGYLRIGQAMLAGHIGDAWNLGPAPGATLAVSDMVARLQRDWPQLQILSDAGPHPHEAVQLALDCSKAASDLGWRPVWDVDTTLKFTAQWYREFLDCNSVRSREDLLAYVIDARRAGLGWAE
ncbi:MAG: CDP-glucose 4,6-dehydratase [Lysobacter sp.]